MKQNAVTFRPARPEDAQAIRALEERLFTSDLMSLRAIRRFIASPRAVVRIGCADGEIVAAMVLLLRRPPRSARLYSLGVARAHRGRGIATALVRHALRVARKAGSPAIRLEVKERNHKARHLYESLGFRAIAALPDYYSDGADALKMAAPLGAAETD